MTSIRRKLLVTLLVGITLIVLLANTVFYVLVSRTLRNGLDAQLERKLRGFAMMAEWEYGEVAEPDDAGYNDLGDDTENWVRFEFAELPLPEFEARPNPEYYQVWDAQGVVLARSPSLQGANLPRQAANSKDLSFASITLPDTRRGRCATMVALPSSSPGSQTDVSPPEVTVSLAQSTEELWGTLRVLFLGTLTAAVAAALLASFLIWVAVRRGLAPLTSLGGSIARLDHDSLDWRFSTEDKPPELQPIAQCLNGLLDRLEEAFQRERRFNSDVAHELRTPVAELRAIAEVSLRRADIRESDRRSYQDALDIAGHMERLITSLLALARCATGQMPVNLEEADMADLTRAAWSPLQDEAETKGLQVNWEGRGNLPLRTDPVILSTVIGNLLSNAVAHTAPKNAIDVRMFLEDGHAVIGVSNPTVRLEPNDLPHIFDTFWRKERTEAGHLGVGLSLVTALARVLGAEVESDLTPDGVFRISLRHPCGQL